VTAVVVASAIVTGQAACSETGSGDGSNETAAERAFVPAPDGPSWAPRPQQQTGGLTAVAEVRGDRYLVHTEHGEVDFLPGINLGSTTPGHQPGEVAISAEDVRRWLPLMAGLGFRVVRIYTILPPAFYDELEAYNRAHEDAPLYLMQGVYLPDESYIEGGDVYAPEITTSFTNEIRDAAAAVHGDLERERRPGRADGEWTTDVSPWLVGWLIGAELDPHAVTASDTRNIGQPTYTGRYFASTDGATPTARWLAARLDEMAAADADRGHAAPVAFINWPTLDPLTHPEEPLESEDMIGLDANTVQATAAWPAGTFASYHAYPYYPDFQRLEPGLQVDWHGEIDGYAGYLMALKQHHAGMPLMITEFGVPSSLGNAHNGTLGRHQGGHSEQEAIQMDADMLRTIRELGLAGAFLFAWTDEWFKVTWNTAPRHAPPDRRQLWHDVLTNEQFFGLVATDALGGEDARTRVIVDDPDLTVHTATDEMWVHLELRFADPPDAPLSLGFDVVDGGADTGRRPGSTQPDDSADYTVVVDPVGGTAQVWVRTALDPVFLDNVRNDPRPPPVDGWASQQMTLNRARVVPTTGQALPAEFFDVGALLEGEMDPNEPDYDSRATWQAAGRTITLRLPWGLLGMSDPSSKQALVPRPDRSSTTVPVGRINLTIDLGEDRFDTDGISWEPWQRVFYEERLKAGIQAYVDALYEVTPR
jgi:hypothetical protein